MSKNYILSLFCIFTLITLSGKASAIYESHSEERLSIPRISINLQEDKSRFDSYGGSLNLALSRKWGIHTSYYRLMDRADANDISENGVGEFNVKYKFPVSKFTPSNSKVSKKLELSPAFGFQRTFSDNKSDSGSSQVGVMGSYDLSEFSSFHGGGMYLLDHGHENFGYALGFNYKIDEEPNPAYLEISFRQLSGIPDSDSGLNIGYRLDIY